MIREITPKEAIEVLKSGKDIFLFDDTDLTVVPLCDILEDHRILADMDEPKKEPKVPKVPEVLKEPKEPKVKKPHLGGRPKGVAPVGKKICEGCGKEFEGHPRAKLCYDCNQIKKAKTRHGYAFRPTVIKDEGIKKAVEVAEVTPIYDGDEIEEVKQYCKNRNCKFLVKNTGGLVFCDYIGKSELLTGVVKPRGCRPSECTIWKE